MPRTITITAPQIRQAKRRAAWMVRLGRRLHPQVVTDSWYEAGCPEATSFIPDFPRLTLLRWRIACKLRGC